MNFKKAKTFLAKIGLSLLIATTSLSAPISAMATEIESSTEETAQADESKEDTNETTEEAEETEAEVEIASIYAIAEVSLHTDDKPMVYTFSKEAQTDLVNVLNEKICEESDDAVCLESKITDIEELDIKEDKIFLKADDYKKLKSKLIDSSIEKLTQEEYEAKVTPVQNYIFDTLIGDLSSATEVVEEEPTMEDNDYVTFDTTQSVVGQHSSDFFWDVTRDGRKQNFNLYIQKDTPVKLEVFYTKDCEAPSITMVSPNTRAFSNKGNELSEGLKIVNRKNLSVAGYDDLAYDVIYIYTTDEDYSGKWLFSYSISETLKETVLISAKVEDGWDSLKEEYKTNTKFFILYYMDPDRSSYTSTDLLGIVQSEERPIINDLREAKEDVPEAKNLTTPFLLLLVLAILGGVAASAYLFHKVKEEKKKQKSHSINKANSKLKKRKAKENTQLEKYLTKYDSQYKDEPEDVEYENMEDTKTRAAEKAAEEALEKKVAEEKKLKEIEEDKKEFIKEITKPTEIPPQPIQQAVYPGVVPVMQMMPVMQNGNGQVQYVMPQFIQTSPQVTAPFINEQVTAPVEDKSESIEANTTEEEKKKEINPSWRVEGDRVGRNTNNVPSWQKVKSDDEENAFF